MDAHDPDLEALFPEDDYRFHMTLRRGDPRAFLSDRDDTGGLRRRRDSLAREAPCRYTALRPGGLAAFEAFAAWTDAAGLGSAAEIVGLAGAFEPDLLFMVRDPRGIFSLEGGTLCFPTGWALDEKLGKGLTEIHGAVPGLNASIGAAVDAFLGRLAPGSAFERANWGLAPSPELNRHPAVQPGTLAANASLESTWLRVERQLLFGLPLPGAVLFGIRIEHHRLDLLARRPILARRLVRALDSMPAQVAVYKGVEAARKHLIEGLINAARWECPEC